MRDISVADLRTAGVRLVYQHDGSETAQDSFELTLSNGNQVTRHQFVGCTIWLLTKYFLLFTRHKCSSVCLLFFKLCRPNMWCLQTLRV